MDRELTELEQVLLKDPFDAATRRRYAKKLAEAERHADSYKQWTLALRDGSGEADAYLAAASSARRAGESSEVAAWIDKARACADFDPGDPRLTELEGVPQPQRLRAIAGGRAEEPRGAKVVSISSTDTVRFSDIIGMVELKKLIKVRIVEPFLNPGLFERFRKRSGGGVMLYGPPGCGKTMIARAIATECKATFTAIGISDILNMWIGESERNLAAIFEKARAETPAVLFFDELDALAYARSKAHSDHTRTLVNEFLNQLDGMSGRNDRVLTLAATNMPWDVDDAMKRPGRFDRQVFVPPPDAVARAEMLRAKLRDVPTEPFDADALAARCLHFSGADMDGLIERAKEAVLGEILDGAAERRLTQQDLSAAADELEPSTLEWLKTARNLVKFGGATGPYKDVEKYLRAAKLY